jgi:ankyrin repeat protein
LGHGRIFQSFLAADSSPYTRRLSDGWTTLCSAIDAGNIAIVRQALDHLVDVEALLPEGIGALHLATTKEV